MSSAPTHEMCLIKRLVIALLKNEPGDYDATTVFLGENMACNHLTLNVIMRVGTPYPCHQYALCVD